MRRDSTYKEIIKSLFIVIFYILYVSYSDIYLFLPPLMGILFLIFHNNWNERNYYKVIAVVICCSFYELDKLLIFGTLPIIFFIIRNFLVIYVEMMLKESLFFILIYIILIYILYIPSIVLYVILFRTQPIYFSKMMIYYPFADYALAILYQYIVYRFYNDKI